MCEGEGEEGRCVRVREKRGELCEGEGEEGRCVRVREKRGDV